MKINTKIGLVINSDLDAVMKSGGLYIKGQVKVQNSPIACRVRLFEKLSGRLIADIPTDKNGNYKFDNLNRLKFFIVAHHPQGLFNAVIQDNVVPK